MSNLGGKAIKPRPVHLNTWEALYFQHELDDLKALAKAGAELGVERFVLDDGWFKGRNDDHAGLGDWVPDPHKYPQGLGPLVEYVRGLGMEFGLWVEPEMVNPNSDLYRAHPDWALSLPGRPRATARNQLVLDLTRQEVSDYLYHALDKLLSDYPIAYLKWDHNRDLTSAGSDGAPAYHRQTLAFYGLLSRLRAAHPGVEIESCAGGGGRIDYGILALTQRVWTSDSNDALERQAIHRGYLRFFPPEVMGAHVGPSPAHTSGRRHTLAFRAATALFGHLGLELDLRRRVAEERAELKAWIETYKRFRRLLHGGRTWRLDRLEPGTQGQGVVAPDGAEALFGIAQLTTLKRRQLPPVRLPGLDAGAIYHLALAGPKPPQVRFLTPGAQAFVEGTLTAPGAVLMEAGLQTPTLPPETVLLIHLQKV